MTAVEIVAWANLLGAAVSLVLQGYAACCGAVRARWLHAAIAAVAGAYVVGYAWLVLLLGEDESTQQWSEVMRGVGPVAWVVAWWAPAALSLVRHRHDQRIIEAAKKVRRED